MFFICTLSGNGETDSDFTYKYLHLGSSCPLYLTNWRLYVCVYSVGSAALV
jgi:hypothetical protein